MIEAVRSWLSSVVVVSLLLSLVRALTPEGTIRRVGSFTGGLVLMAAILRPLAGGGLEWRFPDLPGLEEEIRARREELEREGEEELERLVAEGTERAVRKKARTLGLEAECTVEVRAAEGTALPWAVRVSCARQEALAEWIALELGVPEERQTWGKPET